MALWTPAAAAGGGLIATSTVTPRASRPPNPAVGNRLHVGTREIQKENEHHLGEGRSSTSSSSSSEALGDLTRASSPPQIRRCHLKGYERKEDQEKGLAASCQKNTE